ncbi:5-carboxymethyl-2-hydroxymuconate isomerase [Nitratireductor sp. CAU 1489]|uniref:5-carboxymethyl-2-hydroxymuconate isomerase n=1 Tax=Nitratireductor arenosus TaxID=2682096 RepID=A0A844QI48_9HYPH|nr:5-carboxymethyl-2-hydroxymuconate isomerase [Nitratireductor arenosus]MVA98965.1 5-carboxymethyl-2-hydroxymuconate isomerase [Nitratireductor arenosus]
MPHFVIEHSAGLDRDDAIEQAIGLCHEAGARSGVMNPDDIKVRAASYERFRFAGGIESFIHVTVSLLEGRTDAQKEGLAVLLRDRLSARFGDVDSISIDVRDMNPVAYKKHLRQPG